MGRLAIASREVLSRLEWTGLILVLLLCFSVEAVAALGCAHKHTTHNAAANRRMLGFIWFELGCMSLTVESWSPRLVARHWGACRPVPSTIR